MVFILTLVGTTVSGQVLDPLAVLLHMNRLYMLPVSLVLTFLTLLRLNLHLLWGPPTITRIRSTPSLNELGTFALI